eukprot:12921639-Prorocentrum_lima.AAC.1
MGGEVPDVASGFAASADGTLTQYLQQKPLEDIGNDDHDYLEYARLQTGVPVIFMPLSSQAWG